MWINLQGHYVNFNLVKSFYRDGKTIVYTTNEKTILYYSNAEKAKQVEEFIVKVLNVYIVTGKQIGRAHV